MNENGFTLLELTIAIAISAVLSLITGDFILNSLHSVNQDYNQSVAQLNAQSTIQKLSHLIRDAKSASDVNEIDDPSQPAGWTAAPGSGGPIILEYPAHDSSGNPIYVDDQHSDYYVNEVIIYLDSSNQIYKRILADPMAPGNASVTTCPPASATSSCPADSLLQESVASINTTYLDNSGTAVDSPLDAHAINLTLQQSATIGDRTYSSKFSTSITLRNN